MSAQKDENGITKQGTLLATTGICWQSNESSYRHKAQQ